MNERLPGQPVEPQRKRFPIPARVAGRAAFVLLAITGVAASCGGNEGENKPTATRTINPEGTSFATSTAEASATPVVPTETPTPSPTATAIEGTPTETPNQNLYNEIKGDLEGIYQKYMDYPYAEKITQTIIDPWEQGKSEEETNPNVAGNHYFGVFQKLMYAYQGKLLPSMTCDSLLLQTGQKIPPYVKEFFPKFYEIANNLGDWDPAHYGSQCP